MLLRFPVAVVPARSRRAAGDHPPSRRGLLRGSRPPARRERRRSGRTPPRATSRRQVRAPAAHRTLAALTALLGLALAANYLLGPLAGDVIVYRYGESMTYQGIGLDAVALLLACPLALTSAWLRARSHRAGPVLALALAPATFTAYRMPQYVIGPDYLGRPGSNEDFALAHMAVLVLAVAVAVAVAAWRGVDRAGLRPASPGSDVRRS